MKPDGVFLSNGPGDPAATGKYAIGIIKTLIKKEIPIFGICLGHQILALALGAKTKKMKLGHRGANHPVKNLINSNVEITSQNHGFEIVKKSLPKNVEITHKSLFDNCIEGIRLKNKPVFSVQYHPESNPGPQDSVYLFQEFINNKKSERIVLMTTKAKTHYHKFKFSNNDTILFGRESMGVPEKIHQIVDQKLIIPIQKNTRSLNIVSSVAITLSEALRQTSNL